MEELVNVLGATSPVVPAMLFVAHATMFVSPDVGKPHAPTLMRSLHFYGMGDPTDRRAQRAQGLCCAVLNSVMQQVS